MHTRITSLHVFCAVLLAALLVKPLVDDGGAPALRTAATVNPRSSVAARAHTDDVTPEARRTYRPA